MVKAKKKKTQTNTHTQKKPKPPNNNKLNITYLDEHFGLYFNNLH